MTEDMILKPSSHMHVILILIETNSEIRRLGIIADFLTSCELGLDRTD